MALEVDVNGSPVPEIDLVKLKVRLEIGDTVTVEMIFDGRTRMVEGNRGDPVPTRSVRTKEIVILDTSDRLEFATLETSTGGKEAPSDVVKTGLTGTTNVILLGVVNSVATPAVTET